MLDGKLKTVEIEGMRSKPVRKFHYGLVGSGPFGTVRYGSVSSGLVRSGLVRFGTVRSGLVRFGTVRSGTVRFGTVRPGTVRYGQVWYGSVRSGLVRFGTVRPGTVQSGLTRSSRAVPYRQVDGKRLDRHSLSGTLTHGVFAYVFLRFNFAITALNYKT